jgi:RNA polymerase sigma-70 factor (ECF subfamily)
LHVGKGVQNVMPWSWAGAGPVDAAAPEAAPGGRLTRVARDPFESSSDEMLMRRYQHGDAAAFAALMRRHLNGVYNFLARQVGGRTPVAEDLAQEVFLRVVERAREFKHEARFSTWLYTIARNLAIDHLRKASLRRHPSLDEANPHTGVTLGERTVDPHPSASAERMASAAEMAERIGRALASLPEEQREVFLLREVARLPFQEIAAITGAPENTVKSRMRYALERLQQGLEDYADEARSLR